MRKLNDATSHLQVDPSCYSQSAIVAGLQTLVSRSTSRRQLLLLACIGAFHFAIARHRQRASATTAAEENRAPSCRLVVRQANYYVVVHHSTGRSGTAQGSIPARMGRCRLARGAVHARVHAAANCHDGHLSKGQVVANHFGVGRRRGAKHGAHLSSRYRFVRFSAHDHCDDSNRYGK